MTMTGISLATLSKDDLHGIDELAQRYEWSEISRDARRELIRRAQQAEDDGFGDGVCAGR